MRNESYKVFGKTWNRVTKRAAEKAYNAGKQVWLAPVLANLNSPWWCTVLVDNTDGAGFNRVLNGFEYYNCNTETGTYAKFFVESEN